MKLPEEPKQSKATAMAHSAAVMASLLSSTAVTTLVPANLIVTSNSSPSPE
jgi:hypothetical protein